MPFWCFCQNRNDVSDDLVTSTEKLPPAEKEIVLECPSTATGSPSILQEVSPKSPEASPEASPGAASNFTSEVGRRAELSFFLDASPSPSGELDELAKLPKDVREELEEAARLTQQGWPFAAEERVHNVLERLRKEDDNEDVIDRVKASQVHSCLVGGMTEVNHMLCSLLDDTGWVAQKEGDGIHVWTRPEPGTDLVTVRIAGSFEGPFENFCSIGKEVQLVKTWMAGVKSSYVVEQLSDFDAVGYYSWKFPLITGREFLVEETNIINDTQGYCVVRRCPPMPREGKQLPEVARHHIRAAISNWCSFTAPVGTDEKGRRFIFTVTVMNVDLKIPLPSYLVNQLSVKMGYQSFQQMRQNLKKAQDPSSPLYKSVADPKNSAYYSRMRDLEQARKAHPIGCLKEIIETGWVKDPAERRKIFARSEGVLVPMAS